MRCGWPKAGRLMASPAAPIKRLRLSGIPTSDPDYHRNRSANKRFLDKRAPFTEFMAVQNAINGRYALAPCALVSDSTYFKIGLYENSYALASYRCTAQPDWNVIESNASADQAGPRFKALLEGTTFEVAVGTDGAAAISRQFRVAPTSEQDATRLRMMANGVELTLVGFFQILANFAFGRLTSVPGPGFSFTETLGSYRITQRGGFHCRCRHSKPRPHRERVERQDG
jgi:hypothetical protein